MSENEGKAELTLEQAISVVDTRMNHEQCSCGACYSCAWIRLQEFIETMQQSAFVCPHCGSYLVRTIENIEEKFLYGDVELEHTCDIRTCLSCGEQWTDMEHDYSQTEAIVQHLQDVTTELSQGLQDVIDLGPTSYYADAARIALNRASGIEEPDEA